MVGSDQDIEAQTIPEVLRESPWLEESLKHRVLSLVIAGETVNKMILSRMGFDPKRGANIVWIEDLRRNSDFEELARKSKQDMIASCTDYLRSRVLAYTLAEEQIAFGGSEERNRLAALKDLSDRAGTGAAMKLSVAGTPAAYREMMREMLKDDDSKKDMKKEAEDGVHGVCETPR